MPEEASLEGTPTWIVASVCSVIVVISLVFERALHRLGKALEHRRRETLYEALLKLKEELMLLGFVSLLLVVFQDVIREVCIDESLMERWLPCRGASPAARHRGIIFSIFRDGGAGARRMLGGMPARATVQARPTIFMSQGEVPLLSLHALEQIHIFIFVLAITHVVLSAVTVLLGLLQMRKWMHWENAIQEEGDSAPKMIIRVQKIKFIQDWCKGHEKVALVIIWMRSFFKQFYGSVSNDDYVAMRLGFVMEHIRGHPKFNFYDYMIKALEKDFKRVVGIKWYHWIFVMIFLLFNVSGWHSNFWISLIPLALLLLIGAKLEHIINKLAYEVATKHFAADEEGNVDMVVRPSDELFWFQSPRLVLVLIHFILFQNAFEFAYFFWTLAKFGFSSCMMDGPGYSMSRIIICVVVEVLCSYSTLPLYAIVTHMGSSFKSAVFADDVAEHIRGWADGARRRNRVAGAGLVGLGVAAAAAEPSEEGTSCSSRMPEGSQPTTELA
ncbi:seven transmembrane protein Mlo3 [Panicum miliaceum]|uniref:MLO-like protein n=1 Tax=Panicum miliaceum TaxID=4540 RepID=A0A3L6Q793_PANMI|nr:seven transmembrane protein Mlo3 [Panicum miliaceum]